ncbi:MAG TPA: competence/damage-inducible protein A [Bacteroidales bacterium]|nr:MAG: damage-inducible protein CinA [Bacteroidetes bacterium GWE2_42_24]OFY27551.1 MAG: damage-inducible protein CinA [Bacteroidetes bacterium GWF2_43_11]HAQ64968.1 competence/damage-inducible protein A [Bacteroidales bacterium]HBZ66075.1 competence/damage-inducible protein A [Bacteroidales bacterium]
MKAEIITIGDELLIGQVIDTNSAWMAAQLNAIGVDVKQITSIADARLQILHALSEAGNRARIVLISGGLGPTRDDITKQTLCEYFDTNLIVDESALADITAFFARRGISMTELNRKQSEMPAVCTSIPNPAGTARGMWFEKDNTIFISMPGVPFEMKTIMTDYVLPALKKRFPNTAVVHRTILTTGLGESFLAARIEAWENSLPGYIKLAYLPQPGIVRLRLTARGCHEDKLQKEIDTLIEKLYGLIPELIFGEGTETLEGVIGKLLLSKKQTMATAESCTGGSIAQKITSVSGSSAYYKGSVVAYSNEIKQQVLNVDHESLAQNGAVSREVVEQMAQGACRVLNTNWAISVSGIAGPDGGTEEKPVGTVWIGVAGPDGVTSQKFLFGDNRERNNIRATIAALNMLRSKILQSM